MFLKKIKRTIQGSFKRKSPKEFEKIFNFDDFTFVEHLGFGGINIGTIRELGKVTVDLFPSLFWLDSISHIEQQDGICIAQRLNHPNIVRLYGTIVENGDLVPIGIAMEYMSDRSVDYALHNTTSSISTHLKYSWICQAGRALIYLHSKGYFYGNMATERMLLTNGLKTLKLNLSRLPNEGPKSNFDLELQTKGPTYPTREILFEGGKKETSSEICSFGISIWEIITRSKPPDGRAANTMFMLLPQSFQLPDCSEIADEEIRNLLEKCWLDDFLKRPTAEEIIDLFERKMKLEPMEQKNCNQFGGNVEVHQNKKAKFALDVVHEGISTFTDSDFSQIELENQGAFGVVYKARNSRFGSVAVKIHKSQWSFDEQRELFHMLKDSTHPNIVRFLGVLLHSVLKSPIGIVMEFMEDKTVYEALHKNPMSIDQTMKYSWISQAARALDYLHSRTLLHRDVKTPNMLLCNQFSTLKICDMGTTRNFNCLETMTGGFEVGTLIYNAPEITASKKMDKYDSSADIYSLSICIWEIVTRRKPFDHIIEDQLPYMLALKAAEQNERPFASAIEDDKIRSFVERGWHREACERPTAAEVSRFFENILTELLNDNLVDDIDYD